MYDGLALLNGFVCIADSIADAVAASDAVAPEHLEIMTRNPRDVSAAVRNAGAIFCGTAAGEVLGDYGAGPNHTLPTGGTARFRAGLSVFDFIRVRTWMELESDDRGGERCRPIPLGSPRSRDSQATPGQPSSAEPVRDQLALAFGAPAGRLQPLSIRRV
jgi:hypothetical protein